MWTEVVYIGRPAAGARGMEAFLARPDAAAPYPAVLVVHEAYGLNDNIREVTQRFADEGFTALAVDLFSNTNRALCLARVMAGMLLRPLHNGVVSELQAALGVLQARDDVDPTRVGVIGFCMGGAFALQLACVNDDLRAASVFYGFNPRPIDVLSRACPIVGSYPEQDITAGAGRKLDLALQRFNVAHDIKIYPGARHSFFNDRGRAFHPDAATDSWDRTLAFFSTHLKGSADSSE